ncbi:hypothetical protein [Oscillatoria sp. FACHB-1407]|uniref:hypothetical protein n=1 Tax=Oscillatoria sp. FACHB-1407 TaxID=2692847 RepID=UPI0018EFC1CE|nr:hypothetical protein [Oscillatoria sp. FACHB-1407]
MDTMNAETTFAVSSQPRPLVVVREQPLPWGMNGWQDTVVDEVAVADCSHWLSSHRAWGQLPTQALTAIAQSSFCFPVKAQTLIYQEGQTPIGLYLLKEGNIEIFRQSPIGKSLICCRNVGDLFGCTLIANAVEGAYQTSAIARFVDPEQPDYLTVVYAYLPVTLAVNLAHYVPAAITEAGQMLPVLARTLGYSGSGLPTLVWSLDVAQFLQGVTLLSAMMFSPYPLWRMTQRSLFKNIPHLLLMLGFTVFFFKLMI